MTTTQAIISQTGAAKADYTLEFRTWNGSAYVWTDYTDRLVDFSGIGSTVEENAFPNAFRMSIGRIELDNTDGKFDNLDVLDGKLYNSAEPYGKGIYKRMVRITDVRDNESQVIGVGLVRDIKPSSHKRTVTIETTSLDARASDQMCDGITAERHPLGGTVKTSPTNWTTSNPASATGNVNLYRWREQETADDQLSYGWFKDRHYADVVERTAWALDDLATDITKSYRLMTSDAREIVTTRNIPPDDATISTVSSTGIGPDRCRALVWNPVRSVLVCCVGHLIYDYDPATNVHTLRNTLTAGRDVQVAFYTTEADSGGYSTRIVLVQCDMTTYAQVASRVATAWCTVLDASGTGAYTVRANEVSLGADVFPGTHNCREGAWDSSTGLRISGNPASFNGYGENANIRFRSRVNILSAATSKLISGQADGDPFQLLPDIASPPINVDRGYISGVANLNSPLGMLYPNEQAFSCCLNIYTAGGRLYYQTWDVSNLYRLKYLNLSTYAAGSYLALGGASSHVPYLLYSAPDAAWKKYLYCVQMEWREVYSGYLEYSNCHVYYYDFSTSAWVEITILSGTLDVSTDAAWMVIDIGYRPSTGTFALWFNRVTRFYRYSRNLVNDFANNTFLTTFDNGAKNQPCRLSGLHLRTTDGCVYFNEAGKNYMWSLSATNVLSKVNKTPASGSGDPINSDLGLGSRIVSTPANYPDASTPLGMLWWISANDYGDAGVEHAGGRYVLCQLANFDAGFIELLDLSGLSFWDLRTQMAERFGYVHYYAPDGTLTFKSRTTSGAAAFNFSSDNRNLVKGEIQTRGFEAIVNSVTVYPYAEISEPRTSDIVKGRGESGVGKDGTLTDVSVSGSPGETSQWQVVFASSTAYSLYKLVGTNYSYIWAKAGGTIDTALRSPLDGLYLTILPSHFEGAFVSGDTFTFWVFEPQESLAKLDDRDKVVVIDATSIAIYRRVEMTVDNRFIKKQIAGDLAAVVSTWRKARHDVPKIEVVSDPNYLPLMRCTLKDENMGYAGSETFQIMGVEHRRHQPSNLILVKV